MGRRKFLANRNAPSSFTSLALNQKRSTAEGLGLLLTANLRFSNRNIPLLEPRLSHSKQTVATGSNGNISPSLGFLTKACWLFDN
jgi:hypothetical protein